MSSFANLKRNSGANIEKLRKAVESVARTNTVDDRYWKSSVDKSGNGYAIIRFLPSPPQDGEDGLPWVKYYDHGFQGPTGLWYIENSLTSIGKTDKISEYNSELWNSGVKADKDQASKQKRRLHYVSNIYVIKDSKHPENEGQVKLFSYGKKIFEKITTAMNPQFEDDQAFDPFDLWEGANFKLKIRQADGYQNYDLSEFDLSGPLFEDDDKMEEIWNKEYSLKEILDPKNFKSPEELAARLDKVLNLTPAKSSPIMESVKVQNVQVKEAEITEVFDEHDDSEDLKFFQNLLEN